MTAGKRRHYCALQSRVDSVDSIGQPSTSWQLVRNVYAEIKYLSGLSTIKAGVDTSIAKVSIRVLHGAFNAGQRLVYGNEVFEIESINPDGLRKEIDLVCVVINADV